jgi:hypothetical protein
VMEYIEGRPIDEYCNQRKLTVSPPETVPQRVFSCGLRSPAPGDSSRHQAG